MFCAPVLVYISTERVGSRFHVLRSRTHFRRYQGCWVPFSCFALPDPFLAVPTASGPVFMFCAPEIIFGGSEGVGSRFHVLRSRTRFRRYRGVGSRYHVLRSRTHFPRYRRRRVRFSYFALQGLFSAVPTALGPFFMFCAIRFIFNGIEGIGSRFRQHRRRRVPFSCFALPDSFSAAPRASGLVFLFALPDPFSAISTASGPVFMFCAPEPVFVSTERVGSRFHVLRSQTHFRR
jgi:hypothetical protein